MSTREVEGPIINLDRYGQINEKPVGLPFKIRKEKLKEVYSQGWDPDELAQGPDYSELERQVQEVLGNPPSSVAGKWWPDPTKFKVREHPHLKRICIFVEQPPNKNTKAPLWFVQSIFWDEPKNENYLPPDYRADPKKVHLRGACGDWRYPTIRDLELIREAVATSFISQEMAEDKLENDSRDKRMQKAHDLADYSFGTERDLANQRAGSGQWMSSAHCDRREDWLPFEDKRYVKIDSGKGWKEKVKVGSQRFIELVLNLAKDEPKLLPPYAASLTASDLEAHLASVMKKLELDELLAMFKAKLDVETPSPTITATEKVRLKDGTVVARAVRLKV